MRPRIDLTAAAWRTSSHSNADGGDCVEVADGVPTVVPVRDSKAPTRATLLMPSAAWGHFVTAVRHDGLTA
ncbi:DUF397 domain-containing protein [Streptomyces lonarensis]|uniref:DUF397 domain-containing protein n=1 Tax=Streptomyces lonarensis TaxID=700599 RepID=A0A7X6D168_9ACTN|nr:DUF397 domain-containing protein [Streptomyces lonarensis]NJQ06113.1 DUF397 domain-containing protein [Streptomyces lonarensis]